MTRPIDAPHAQPTADPLVARLRSEAAENVGGGLALVAGGLVASLVTVWVLVVLLWLLVGLPGLGFRGWFVLIGLLFGGLAAGWLRVRPKYSVESAFEYVDPRQEWLGVGKFGPFTIPGAAADLAFVGPRMIWAGIEQRLNREPPSRERFFDRCALLLRQLGRAGEAVPLEGVEISEDETGAKLRPVLDYLDRLQWIGLNSSRTRVWLSSRAKLDLLKMGIVAATPDPA